MSTQRLAKGLLGPIAFCAAGLLNEGYGATLTTATCSQGDVQAAIDSAAPGDTVQLPAAACAWSRVTLAKSITLTGMGQTRTVIDVSNGNPVFVITRQTNGPIRIANLAFVARNNNNLPHPIYVQGGWPQGQPVVFRDVTFTATAATLVDVKLPGGVIFSRITFNGGWNDFLLTVKELTTNSWQSPDSIGNRDLTGLQNLYIEDSVFNGGSNGIVDCDDNCRIVVRKNQFINSGGFNSHGKDTSTHGMRHFEIYDNSFTNPDTTCPDGITSLSNINQFIWIRGGTGVIYNNSLVNLRSQCWGDKPEIRLSIRGAEDVRPQGSCTSVKYPVPHQLGQNHDGTSYFLDPIRLWNNSQDIAIYAGWQWGNPCGFSFADFFQWGRDGINGTPRPGYTPYQYPHPLAAGTAISHDLQAPTNLTATLQ